MRKINYGVLLVLILAAAGCRKDSASPAAEVAVSNPYFSAIVCDLLGPDEPVLLLAGPGNCPGHFDIAPHQVAELCRCKILLRFDFQKHFDRKMQPAVDRGLKILEVKISGGMCEPDSYLSSCRQVAAVLVDSGRLTNDEAEEQLDKIESRLAALAERTRERIASTGLAGAAVLCSNHQMKFCRWLGLNVVGTFSSRDAPAELAAAVRAGRKNNVRLILGNVPQGRAVPNRLAELLGAKVVMFDNFPPPDSAGRGFDTMLQNNINALFRVWEQHDR